MTLDEISSKARLGEAELKELDSIPESAEDGFAYFWEKEASSPEPGKHDRPKLYRIEDNTHLRLLVRDLRHRTFVSKIPLTTINPQDTSIIKWISLIRNSFPKLEHDAIDDLITNYRGKLKTSSKKHGKFIIGALLIERILILVHSRIDPGLIRGDKGDMKMYTADLVLHPKSVIRADLLDFGEDEMLLSPYEYDRTYSKGHAEFWGIRPRDVYWEHTDSIRFVYSLDSEEGEVIRPASFDEVGRMLESGELSTTGEARWGAQEAAVSRVEVSRSSMSFSDFYQQYILLSEDVAVHSEFFRNLISPGVLAAYDASRKNKYDYEEDLQHLFQCAFPEHKDFKEKKHPNYILCYFTEVFPGIRPLPPLTETFYRALFSTSAASVLHVGEPISVEPICIGNLHVYNEIEIEEGTLEFVNELIVKLSDYSSKKGRAVLEGVAARILKHSVSNLHLPLIFDFIYDDYIAKKMDGAFARGNTIAKESEIEFKSKDDFLSSGKRFVENKLVPDILRYTNSTEHPRMCIIYGINDDGTVDPIANLPSDRLTAIQNLANKRLLKARIVVETHAIKAKGGFLLLVIFVPT